MVGSPRNRTPLKGRPVPTPTITRYHVQWRFVAGFADEDNIGLQNSTVAVTDGYTTFESIRTILSVRETGRQTPEIIDVLTITKLEVSARPSDV
jgi:hypothetical protein